MKTILYFLLAFSFTAASAQSHTTISRKKAKKPKTVKHVSFEGVISYTCQIELTPKALQKGLRKEELEDKLKDDGIWADTVKTFYKGAYYYSSYGSRHLVYKPETNKCYAFRDSSDICTITDASKDPEFIRAGEVPVVTVSDTTVPFHGFICKVVRVAWKNSYTDYYYKPGYLTVNPKLYAKHAFEGWNEYLNVAEALPLKVVKNVNGLVEYTTTMISVQQQPVDRKQFKLPVFYPDYELAKMSPSPTIQLVRIRPEPEEIASGR